MKSSNAYKNYEAAKTLKQWQINRLCKSHVLAILHETVEIVKDKIKNDQNRTVVGIVFDVFPFSKDVDPPFSINDVARAINGKYIL